MGLPVKEAGRELKARLGAAFGGCAFSVCTKAAPLDSIIRVSWTGGPTEAQVRQIAAAYPEVWYDSGSGEALCRWALPHPHALLQAGPDRLGQRP